MRRLLTVSIALAFLASCGGCDGGGEPPPPPPCAVGLADCSGTCADLNTDEANCGACGAPCTGEALCAGGVCEVTCAGGLVACGDTCFDLQTDMAHCGACGNACTGGTVCLAGVCQPACGPLLERCGSGATAVCADLAASATHCGGCGSGCTAGLVCEGGACATPCAAGEARCGGTCVGVAVRAGGLGLPGVRASPTSAEPLALAMILADGDAIEDLVVSERTSTLTGQLEVLHGVGDGTFAPYAVPSVVPLDFVPSSVAVGDVDGDGFADLVVGTADATVTSVAILSGDGTGAFFDAGLAPLDAGAGPRAVALAFVDGGASPDLVIGDGPGVTASNLRVFLNDGLGTFGAAPGTAGAPRLANYSYGVLADVRQVVVGQFDASYEPDLLAVSAGSTSAGGEILLGNGDGSFRQPTVNTVKTHAFALAGAPTATVAADLNGDFILDWSVAHAATHQLRVFVNQGSGVASPQEEYDVAEPLGLAAADPDADGKLDLLSANGAASATFFHRNLGPGFGGVVFARPVRLPAGDRPAAVAVASLASGETWILTANALGSNVSAALATATGFVVPDVYPTDVSADAVTLGDFDGDAWLDFAAASAWTNEVRVFRQARPSPPAADFSTFTSIALPLDAAPSAIAAGDVDADGATDLAVAMSGRAQVGLLLGDGAGAFAPIVTVGVGAEPSALVLAQLDGFAGLDLATADAGSNQVTVFASSGAGTFGAPLALASGPSPVALAAVDLDDRGCSDLVTANAGNGTVSVFRCDPAVPGAFGAALPVTACAGARSIAAARVDADVLPDLIVGCADGLVVLSGLGGGAFTTGTPSFLGLDAAALRVADVDGDGVKDLVVASPGNGAIALLRGSAAGTWSAPELFTAGGSPVGLAVGAVDGDGQLDVVAAVTRPSTALIGAGAAFLRGTCTP